MKKLTVRDPGSGDPKDSADYESSMAQVISLISGLTEKGREAREEEHEYEPVETNPTNRNTSSFDGEPSLLARLKKETRNFKKEVKGVFSDVTFQKEGEDGELLESKQSKTSFQHLQIPFSWYKELKREYRGREVADIDAIQILAYVVYCYRLEYTPQILLRIRPRELQSSLDITEGRTQSSIRHLEKEGLIKRIIIKGITPWYYREDKTSGSYRYIVPKPKKLREITYNVNMRYDFS